MKLEKVFILGVLMVWGFSFGGALAKGVFQPETPYLDITSKINNTVGVRSQPERLIDLAARALAKMEKPDFSMYYDGDVADIFYGYFMNSTSKLNFVLPQEFRDKVQSFSNDEVELVDANGNDFKFILKTTQAGYFILRNKVSGREQLVILNISNEPVIFTERKGE